MLEELAGGAREQLAVDTVVFTGDWIPDHELARQAGLTIDPGTLGPATDAAGRSDLPGLWAAGNLVHPVETADRAALGGRQAAAAMVRSLSIGAPSESRLSLRVAAPLRWVWPNLLVAGERVETLVLRLEEPSERKLLRAEQAGRVIGEVRLHGRTPNRRVRASGSVLDGHDPGAGTVTLTLA